jgi:hypothetical protein
MSPRVRSTQSAGRKSKAATAKPVRRSKPAARSSSLRRKKYVCPDCGAAFDRPQSLGAHRRQAHGTPGLSQRSQSRARSAGRTNARSGRRAVAPSSRAGGTRANSGSRTASAARGQGRGTSGVDRDGLLAALFPAGIPASVDVIRALNDWLDEADRLKQMA